MVFKNRRELIDFLCDKAYNALRNAQTVVYDIIQDYLQQFYADYDPVLYNRTEQLLRSLVKGDIRASADGFVADIYFDLSSLNYATGNNPTGEQVMKAAAQGLHGAIGSNLLYVDPTISGGTGVSVWNDPLNVLDAEAIRILRDRLVEEGIPIK